MTPLIEKTPDQPYQIGQWLSKDVVATVEGNTVKTPVKHVIIAIAFTYLGWEYKLANSFPAEHHWPTWLAHLTKKQLDTTYTEVVGVP